ncbi:MAG TPA: hypothetical protein VF126_10070 [Acidobacteriaceae bacterium]
MRRSFILVVLFLITVPVQLSVLGCGSNPNNYCNAFGNGFGTKKGQLVSFTLEPQQTGISLAYGQVGTLTAGNGKDCAGASVSTGTVHYGIVGPTPDPTFQNADVSPSGQVCAGHWNRQSTSGVTPFTTCIPANVAEVASATATAGAGNASSNSVQIYIHPPVTNVALNTTASNGAAVTDCLSQFQSAQLDATAFVTVNGQQKLYCGPNNSSVPTCSSVLGHLTYAAQSTTSSSGTGSQNSIVTIDQNGVATAKAPGAALITASISGTSSSAGYFHTCPPQSITLTANGGTKVVVKPNTPQPTTATVIDTKGNTITGVPLSYTSTDQRTVGVSGSGAITSTFFGSSSVYAVCAPPTCNPAPINLIGVNGNGTPIASNSLDVNSPGSASSYLWMASPKSQYFTPLDLSQSTIGTPVHMPYTPNSMVLDQTGTSLYFGSYRELMVYAAATNTLIKEDVTVPGVVLAVSPINNEVVINDRARQILYVYQPEVKGSTTTGGSGSSGSTGTPASIVTQYGGVAQHAAFSPDGSTIYMLGTNKLYVYNTFTGWSTETLDASNGTPSAAACPANGGPGADANTAYNIFCSPDVTLAVPQFGAFLSGQNTTARGYCPDTRVTPIDNYPSAVSGGAVGYGFTADHLTGTTNGEHVISATAGPTPQLIDSNVVVPTNATPPAGETVVSGACPVDPTTKATLPITIGNPANYPVSLAKYAPSLIHQVVSSPNSSLAIVTYDSASATPGNAVLPVYKIPAPGTAGSLADVKLTGAQATTPVAAIFSPDYSEIFVSTGGDGNMHIVTTNTLDDTEQFTANLPDGNGGVTPAEFLAVKPRAIP